MNLKLCLLEMCTNILRSVMSVIVVQLCFLVLLAIAALSTQIFSCLHLNMDCTYLNSSQVAFICCTALENLVG
jgi:hypothetical protein